MTNEDIEKSYLNKYNNGICVTVTYVATITATVRLPSDLTIEEIKEELKDGYSSSDLEDVEHSKLEKMTELIVSGYEIEI